MSLHRAWNACRKPNFQPILQKIRFLCSKLSDLYCPKMAWNSEKNPVKKDGLLLTNGASKAVLVIAAVPLMLLNEWPKTTQVIEIILKPSKHPKWSPVWGLFTLNNLKALEYMLKFIKNVLKAIKFLSNISELQKVHMTNWNYLNSSMYIHVLIYIFSMLQVKIQLAQVPIKL